MATQSTKTTEQIDKLSEMSVTEDHDWWSLIRWPDLEHWMQDNHHIHSHYRRASYSYARSFASIFQVHNETVNIWTHLVPAVISLPTGWMLYNSLKPRYDKADTGDVLAMSCFFLGAALCLGMSATFHTLSNHSPMVSRAWNQLDYAGISFLIAGSFVPSVFYGFYCEPHKQIMYWAMVSSKQQNF
jgi:adiponectin receptor